MADTLTIPYWPRFLSRAEAAAYVGVSVDTFEEEVAAGMWPAPLRRGRTGRRLTWDKAGLDMQANRMIGEEPPPPLDFHAPPPQQAVSAAPNDLHGEAALLRRIAG